MWPHRILTIMAVFSITPLLLTPTTGHLQPQYDSNCAVMHFFHFFPFPLILYCFERIVAARAIHGNNKRKAKDYKWQDMDMAIKIIRAFFWISILFSAVKMSNWQQNCLPSIVFTFQNWISQPRYFCKWVELANGLSMKDVLAMTPAIHREHFTYAYYHNLSWWDKCQGTNQCYHYLKIFFLDLEACFIWLEICIFRAQV